MNSIVVIFAIFFITIIGYASLRIFNLLEDFDDLLKISYSFGLGVIFVCFQLYLYSRLNIRWERQFLILPWLIPIFVIFFKNRKSISFRLPKLPKTTLFEKMMIIGIVISFCYVVFEALIRPATTWDSWATWLFQSKVFFIDGRINAKIFTDFHLNYPFAYNLFGTFTYILLGKIDDTAVLLNSTAFYFFLTLLFFTYTKRLYGLKRALLFTFLLVTIQNLIRHGGRLEAGIADLPVGYYSFCCLTLLLEYVKKNNVKIFLILNIFLGFITIVKPEGTIVSLFIVIYAAYHIYKNKLYQHLPLLFFWLFPIMDWEIYRKINGLQAQSFIESAFKLSLAKTINAFLETLREMINIRSWNLLWIIYFYSLFFMFKKVFQKKELIILNFIIISQIFVYILIYILFSANYAPESSIERLLVHLAPLALLEVAILTSSFDLKKKNNLWGFGNRQVMVFVNYFISVFNRK